MSDSIEVIDVNEERIDQELVQAIAEAGNGQMKKVASAGESYIRRKLRENSFTRKVLPHKQVDDSDLTYALNTELPVVVEEMEPLSPGAVSLSFNDHPDVSFYRRDKFVVYFSKISTPEFVKNTDELRVGKSPLRKIITDNALRDIDYQEDKRFIDYIDTIVGTPAGVGAAGVQQAFSVDAAITRDSYVDSISHLEDQELNNGVFLANRKTANQFVKFGRDEAGGDLSEELLKKGREALVNGIVMNIPHSFTIKRQLVPDNLVYQFTTPDYLGRAYVLEPVRMYVEKKKDILRFSAVEKLGVTIANVAGVARHQFDADTDGT